MTIIRSGTFENNTILDFVELTENSITLVEPGAFRNTQITALYLHNNMIGEFRPMVEDILSTLAFINIDNNAITKISVSDFVGLTALQGLLMSDNPVLEADAAAFAELTSMAVLPRDFRPVRDFNGGYFLSGIDYPVNPGDPPYYGNRVNTHTPLSLGSWPRNCEWTGPLINNMTCDECTFGYVNSGSTCIWPTFGLRPDAWNQTEFENDPQMNVRGADGSRVLILRRRITLDPPAVTLDHKHSFVGYTDGDYVRKSSLPFVYVQLL